MPTSKLRYLAIAGLSSLPFIAQVAHAQAQATQKPDGKWREAVGASFTNATGNTRANSLSFNFDVVRVRDIDKWQFLGNALYAKSQGTTTGRLAHFGTRYDRNLTSSTFAFFGADFDHDRIAELRLRSSGQTGFGYKLINTPDNTFNLLGGVGYTHDKYEAPQVVDGNSRSTYSYATGVIGEESTHKLTPTVSAKQKLTILPLLNGSGIYRANFDAGLQVAMTSTLNLTVGFNAKHNSDPGIGIKKTDTLLTTGLSLKFD
jgi:putative salt-induced outer membrane protein